MDDPREPLPIPPRMADAAGRDLEHWTILALSLVALAVFAALGLFLEPDARGFGTHEQLGLPTCKPMEWWGIPCPGCGVTTSVALLAHGRPWESFQNQPFGFSVALAIPAFAAWCVVSHFRGRNLHDEIHRAQWGKFALGSMAWMIAAWVYKLVLVRHGSG